MTYQPAHGLHPFDPPPPATCLVCDRPRLGSSRLRPNVCREHLAVELGDVIRGLVADAGAPQDVADRHGLAVHDAIRAALAWNPGDA